MLTERRDYILRLIQQAGAAARRLREQLIGEADSATEVASEADQEISTLLGGAAMAPLIERVDAVTAVQLIGDKERIRAWIELLAVRAQAFVVSGDDANARRVVERASALRDAAVHLPSR
ncbi:MAG: hypothetical protein ACRENH_11780 [Gemmatimonadaceae bacterium]